ncbi:NAD(P)-dependent oxidoreductase [Sulfitobacter geojensis]|uniref:NAD(P)-dependent oxidoreductase n=1 Tax=Sulfitobacter geojensis TaxID=1342299 RepID=UPI000468E492|nr:NAD(P)-dependent oxidoreductase [Sulfitobacter geojensis]KHA54097.1 D-beta-hydroxybutyrate dehydrogenase [Sulfitobacter geojensis]NYI29915.1 3-hydroxyisobutyrate dehydrogenase-like beta-hydroxyacid dehydrogenase [Sulfitobacter geojensis]
MQSNVGVIGLGIMGSSYAENLLQSGHAVVGFDPDPAAQERLRSVGGKVCATPAAVAQECGCILVSLASVDALVAVTTGPDGVTQTLQKGATIIDMGTLPVAAKQDAKGHIENAGGEMLDCPVSGTGAQAKVRDLVVFASGAEHAIEKVQPILDAIARQTQIVGAFGNGTKLKLVANLLVAVHNVAAAEALVLAKNFGLDLDMVHNAIRTGAGGSRMFDLRGPMMVNRHFEPATMKVDVFLKDIDLILAQAARSSSATPLMSVCADLYARAMDQGLAKQDTASVFEVMDTL